MLRRILEYFKTNFWLLPTLYVLTGAGFAITMLKAEGGNLHRELKKLFPNLSQVGADGARETLSAIASSVITVAGVAFSITIVVLALASSQYSPRVLRNFMKDWKSQSTLGCFLGVFTYCLLVLRTIRSQEDSYFVPTFAVYGSTVLALISVFFIIFFIHHVAESIRASNIIHSIYLETSQAIREIYPRTLSEISEINKTVQNFNNSPFLIMSPCSGYIQNVSIKKVADLARKQNLTVSVQKGIGEFVTKGALLLATSRSMDSIKASKLQSLVKIGNTRSLEMDVAFGIRQLVDIALKGLSPGINDVTTALIAVDYLGALLAELSPRDLFLEPVKDHQDLVFFKTPNFEDFLCESFDQIIKFGEKDPAVLRRVLLALNTILEKTTVQSRVFLVQTKIIQIKVLCK